MLLLPDNPAFIVEFGNRSALLHTLLNRIVAALAKRLKIVRVVEEVFIALVWFDVVNNGCGYHLISPEVKLAEWLLLKLVISQPVPTFGVIEMMPR